MTRVNSAAPTIYNGVMYVVNGKWTFALDSGNRQADLAHTRGIGAGDHARPLQPRRGDHL